MDRQMERDRQEGDGVESVRQEERQRRKLDVKTKLHLNGECSLRQR